MSEFKFETLPTIQKEAESYNCDVVIAKDNELQFDLDDERSSIQFNKWFGATLTNRFKSKGLIFSQSWQSKNGNRHVTAILPHGVNLTVPERIALQLAGGSDPKREFAALCCHWDGSPHPILLFKPKQKEVAPTAIPPYSNFGMESSL